VLFKGIDFVQESDLLDGRSLYKHIYVKIVIFVHFLGYFL